MGVVRIFGVDFLPGDVAVAKIAALAAPIRRRPVARGGVDRRERATFSSEAVCVTLRKVMPELPLRYKRFEIFRDYVKHEDHLINHRITWNLGIQGLLFAAFGYCLQKFSAPRPPLIDDLIRLIPVAGIALSLFAVGGIFAAFLSFRTLCWKWEEEEEEERKNGGEYLPILGGGNSKVALLVGLVASFGPALFVTAVWLGIRFRLRGWSFSTSALIGGGFASLLMTIAFVLLYLAKLNQARAKQGTTEARFAIKQATRDRSSDRLSKESGRQ